MRYAANGLPVVPILTRGKTPIVKKGFHARSRDAEQVRRWWSTTPEANIGAVPADRGAIAFDVDSPDAVAVARALGLMDIPTYRTVTANGEHRWFRAPADLPRGRSVALGLGDVPDPDGTADRAAAHPRVLRTRYDAGYVLMPPSVHPSGATYRADGLWDDMADLPALAAAAYSRRVAAPDEGEPDDGKTASRTKASRTTASGASDIDRRVAAYLEKVASPSKGNRNDTCYRVAAALVNDFALPEGDALEWLRTFNAARCTPGLPAPELEKCLKSALDHGKHAVGAFLENGERATHPAPTPAATKQPASVVTAPLPDPGSPYAAVKTTAEAVAALNRDFAVVLVGDGASVLRETMDDNDRRIFKLLSVQGFAEWLRPYRIFEGPKRVSIAAAWLESPQRRQYERIVFSPAAPHTEPVAPKGAYNLWRGFAAKPSADPSGSACQLFIDHMADNVCNGDEKHFVWLMGWFAQIMQDPARKKSTSIVLRGKQGTGKTIVGKTIGALLGGHYGLFSEPRYLTGRFNSHLMDLLLLHLDEATWGGDHAAAGRLKSLVTSDVHPIEFKGREPLTVRNLVRVMITGNSDWLVPAGMEDRRFYILDVGEGHMQDHAYFAALERQMNAGGREALLGYLLAYDLSDIDLDTIPTTAGLLDQKLASLTSCQQWWHDTLQRGVLAGDTEGTGEAPCDSLYASYIDHASRTGRTRRSMETEMGVFLSKAVPGLARVRRWGADATRFYCYSFPKLADCRAAWLSAMRTDVTPDEGERTEWSRCATVTARRWP